MIDYVYIKINRFANIGSIISLFFLSILLMVVINTINLPISTPRINEFSHGAGILDMRFFYNSQEAYLLLGRLGAEGRLVYMKLLTAFDFVFPLIYSLCLSVILAVIFRNTFPDSARLQKLCLIPFAAGMFDWLENISILTMLLKYPKFIDSAYMAGFFTLGKWVFTWLSISLIVVGTIFTILHSRQKKTVSSTKIQ